MSCDFMCLLNPTGARCTCPEGKLLVNGTCGDVNISGKDYSCVFMPQLRWLVQLYELAEALLMNAMCFALNGT